MFLRTKEIAVIGYLVHRARDGDIFIFYQRPFFFPLGLQAKTKSLIAQKARDKTCFLIAWNKVRVQLHGIKKEVGRCFFVVIAGNKSFKRPIVRKAHFGQLESIKDKQQQQQQQQQ